MKTLTIFRALSISLALSLPTQAAYAASIEMVKTTEYKGADIDPDGIWTPSELQPFGGANAVRKSRGANITEYKAVTPAGTFLLSQVLSADCSAQLCPARLFKLSGANKFLLVDDMMHIGGPFTLNLSKRELVNGDITFQFDR